MATIRNIEMSESKVTVYVVACWILAACGGLMFGYDIGISGIYFTLSCKGFS